MRVVEHDGPLEPLAAGWRELFDADERATPFSAPGWILPWWRDDARVAVPVTVKVLEGRELVGLAPMAVRRQGPFRVMFGAGTGVGNYWDVLAAERDRVEATRLVAAYVAANSNRWDALLLDRCDACSPLPPALAGEGLPVRVRPPIAAPRLTLPASFDDYLGRLTRNARSSVRRALRRADSGELEVRQITGSAEVADAMSHWHELRVRWWNERDRDINPDHVRPQFGRFAAEAMQHLVPNGRAEVLELRHDGRRVGVHVNFVDDRTIYWWLGGFEPSVAPLGPGGVIASATIRAAIATGRRYVDFMVGQEPYKYRYGAVDRWMPYRVFGTGRARSSLLLDALRWRDARRRHKASNQPAQPSSG